MLKNLKIVGQALLDINYILRLCLTYYRLKKFESGTITEEKAEALQKWIKDNQQKYTYNIIGGILNYYHPSWKINKKDVYVYENTEAWEDLLF